MRHKDAHSHGWIVGVLGLAAGVALMVVFPKLKAVGGVVLLVGLFHLVGLAVVLGSVYALAPRRFGRWLELAEIRRVLKPGGRLLMVVWVPGWTTFTLANAFCLLLTTKTGWRRLAAEVGFSIRDEGTFNGMWFAVLERPR